MKIHKYFFRIFMWQNVDLIFWMIISSYQKTWGFIQSTNKSCTIPSLCQALAAKIIDSHQSAPNLFLFNILQNKLFQGKKLLTFPSQYVVCERIFIQVSQLISKTWEIFKFLKSFPRSTVQTKILKILLLVRVKH